MKTKLRWALGLLFFGVAAAAAATSVQAQIIPHTETFEFSANAVAPAQPYLAIELLPSIRNRQSANAAVYYGKVKSEQNNFFGNQELLKKIYDWTDMPLDELRKEPNPLLPADSVLIRRLREGARCDFCDWQLPLRESENFYYILLPEVQESRLFAYMLASLARWQIAHGQYDEALITIQTGYALGRHVAAGETVINGLVGTAISNAMHHQLITLMQQPDAPNLYWALTALPRPLIDMRSGIESEMDAVDMSFGDLADLDGPTYTEAWWSDKFAELVKLMVELNGSMVESDQAPEKMIDDPVSLVVSYYPMAKEILLAEGIDPAKVEAMPTAQAVIVASLFRFRVESDRVTRHLLLSHQEARQFPFQEKAENDDTLPPFRRVLVMPLEALRNTMLRQDRMIALMRTYEALRAHAAANEGKLPDSLDQITIVPVPNDPATDLPFKYELVDGVGRIIDESVNNQRIDVKLTLRSE